MYVLPPSVIPWRTFAIQLTFFHSSNKSFVLHWEALFVMFYQPFNFEKVSDGWNFEESNLRQRDEIRRTPVHQDTL